MSLIFIFNNISTILMTGLAVLFILVAVRFLYPSKFFASSASISSKFGQEEKFWWVRPAWVKNISYWWIVGIAIVLYLSYGAFVTWGQYYVWANGNEFTKVLISAPMSSEVPLPGILEWSRSYLEQPLGYFAHYVFGRVWLNIIILFAVSGLFYSILKFWSFYRGGFLPNGPEIILALLLIVGYPGILVLIPLGFIMAIIWFVILSLKNRTTGALPMYIEPAFLLATPIVFFFSKAILSYF